ncbi:MAG: hypothetical protein GY924_14160 [Planctomycetaceae bacterium]|nr:hypothetical protein [Planctomycetaceae bacterium]
MSAASENESVPSLAENGRITVLETSDRVSLAPPPPRPAAPRYLDSGSFSYQLLRLQPSQPPEAI